MLNNEFNETSNPEHYSGDGKISCMVALKSMMHNASFFNPMQIYWWGCAFKYLWRWPWKNGIKDIDKAIQCMQYLKEEVINEDGE